MMPTDLDMTLLARIVERYDDGQQPVTAASLADVLDRDESEIRDCLANLTANELLAPVDAGYRPTVTARELLALDIDLENELVVLDFDAPEERPPETRDRAEHGDDSPGEGSQS
jgi:predicted transcriptional regulator